MGFNSTSTILKIFIMQMKQDCVLELHPIGPCATHMNSLVGPKRPWIVSQY